MHTYSMNDKRFRELFFHVFLQYEPFCNCAARCTFPAAGALQRSEKAETIYDTRVPRAIEAKLYFHVTVLITRKHGKKKLKIKLNAVKVRL